MPIAMKALNDMREGVIDENVMLAHLNNPVKEIKNLVVQLSADWKMLEGHITVLEGFADSLDNELKKNVINLAQRIPSDKAVELLTRFLNNYESEIHTAAFDALDKRILTSKNLPALEKIVNDVFNPSHRLAAISLIAKIEGEGAAHLLLNSLADYSSEVRTAAAKALERFKLNNRALDSLKTLLTGFDSDTRLKAVKLAATITTSEALALLIPLLDDGNEQIRTTLASLLPSFKFTNKEIPLLKKVLIEGGWEARENAVFFLSKIGSLEAAEAIIPSLADRTAICQAAFVALNSLPSGPTLVPALAAVSKTASAEGRKNTAKILARIKVQSATEVLFQLVFDYVSEVQEVALSAISGHPFTVQQVNILLTMLEEMSSTRREKAARMLGFAGDCRALASLRKEQKRELHPDVLEAIAAAIEQLSQCK